MPKSQEVDRDVLLSRVQEIEKLLRSPEVKGHANRAMDLGLSIARKADTAAVRAIAMELLSETTKIKRALQPRDERPLADLLSRLRAALSRPAAPG